LNAGVTEFRSFSVQRFGRDEGKKKEKKIKNATKKLKNLMKRWRSWRW
jgi:hypothetical protein